PRCRNKCRNESLSRSWITFYVQNHLNFSAATAAEIETLLAPARRGALGTCPHSGVVAGSSPRDPRRQTVRAAVGAGGIHPALALADAGDPLLAGVAQDAATQGRASA